MIEVIKKGQWIPIFTCRNCQCVVDIIDIEYNVCPHCDMVCNEDESIAVISKRRFLYYTNPKWYQIFKTCHGRFEYSYGKY